jgi:hypothetical protein
MSVLDSGIPASASHPVDTLMSAFVGPFWTLASGTIDPWSKDLLQSQETSQLNTAKGGDYPSVYGPLTPSEQAASAAQSGQDVTIVLTQAGADPSQFWQGLKNSLSEAFSLSGSLGRTVFFIGIGGLLIMFTLNKLGSK